jgi:arabinose-5-phosphate isomerase
VLKELVAQQQAHVNYFFKSLDLQPVDQLIQLLLKCTGMIFFTGVGKSGLIAKKIAFTMVSTGTRAFYLSPTDAVHGDLGMISSQDVFIMISKSGETDELIGLVPAIQNKGTHLVSIVCEPKSRLAMMSQTTITLPFQQELCPFNMAPTMSTTSQLLLGDLLAMTLMRHKNFSLQDYILNHPSGQIGKRMTFRVKDIMLKDEKLPLCKPEDKLGDILVELSNKRCGCILIIDDHRQLLGIFTDGDLRRALQKMNGNILNIQMKTIMTVHPRSIGPEALAWDAMKIMEATPQQRIMMLPVIDEAFKLQGLIHLHDIIQSGL